MMDIVLGALMLLNVVFDLLILIDKNLCIKPTAVN